MGPIGRFFDRVGRKQTLEYVRFSVVTSVLFCVMGTLELARSHKTGEGFGLYWGIFLVAFGLFDFLYKFLVIRAVVRRLKAEAES